MTTPRPPDGGAAAPLTEEEERIQRDLGGKAWSVRGWCAVHQQAHRLRDLMIEHQALDAARDSRSVGEGAPDVERVRVEPGHNHTTDGLPTYPVCRTACPLGCDKPLAPTEQIEISPGRFIARPRRFVVDPIAEGEAAMAVAEAKGEASQ